MHITQTIKDSVFVLVNATKQSDDLQSLQQYFADNLEVLTNALKFIGITDSEPLIDIAHQTLWQVCPEELEDHVQGCAGVYMQLIANAWQHHDEDLGAAIKQWFDDSNFKPSKTKKSKKGMVGALPTDPNPKDIEHLNKCLSL